MIHQQICRIVSVRTNDTTFALYLKDLPCRVVVDTGTAVSCPEYTATGVIHLLYWSERLPSELLYWKQLFRLHGIERTDVTVTDIEHPEKHYEQWSLIDIKQALYTHQPVGLTDALEAIRSEYGHALDAFRSMDTLFVSVLPKAVLLETTSHAGQLVSAAAATCYSDRRPSDVLSDELEDETDTSYAKRITKCVQSGHHSVLEHASFTFELRLNRSASHQLVRHRLASYSQNSQRYIAAKPIIQVIVPQIYQTNMSLLLDHLFNTQMCHYYALRNKTVAQQLGYQLKNEDVRSLYTNNFATCIVMTMNARSLLHFFNERCCACAEWTIRVAAHEMLRQCKEVCPALFATAGPKCTSLGYCPEAKARSCGKAPLRSEVLQSYHTYSHEAMQRVCDAATITACPHNDKTESSDSE